MISGPVSDSARRTNPYIFLPCNFPHILGSGPRSEIGIMWSNNVIVELCYLDAQTLHLRLGSALPAKVVDVETIFL